MKIIGFSRTFDNFVELKVCGKDGNIDKLLVTPRDFREMLDEVGKKEFDAWWGPIHEGKA